MLFTLNELDPPPEPTEKLFVSTESVAGPNVAWVTVTCAGLPAAPGIVTVIVPTRSVVNGLASTVNETVPELTPLPPLVMCTKSSAVSAV